METTPYQMAINNIARFIKDNPAKAGVPAPLDAFTASFVISVAFCKMKEDVITDIINAHKSGE